MSSGISVPRYTSESLRWKEGAEGKLLFLEDILNKTASLWYKASGFLYESTKQGYC